MKKRILIVPANTDLNRGDQALTWESIAIAKNITTTNPEIFLYQSSEESSNQSKVNYQTSEMGHEFLTRILQHPRRNARDKDVKYNWFSLIRWGIIAVADTIITLLLLTNINFLNKLALKFLTSEQQKTYDVFKSLSAVIVKGGGFLHSYGKITDVYVMYFQLFDVLLANKLGIKVYVLPNSVGPLKNSLARWVVKHALSKASLVCARESVSKSFLIANGIDAVLSPDLGFYLAPSEKDFSDYLKARGVYPKRNRNIAITLRPYRFDGASNANELYVNYLYQFEIVITALVKKGYSVSLVAHTLGPSAHENDSLPLLELYEKFKDVDEVVYLYDKSLTSKDIEKIYSYYDLVIGTRFHSVIFALNVNTPSIAIAYGGNKAIGIMNDMKMSNYVVPIENTNASVISGLVEQAFEEEMSIKERIKVYRQGLNKERQKIVNIIKNDIGNSLR